MLPVHETEVIPAAYHLTAPRQMPEGAHFALEALEGVMNSVPVALVRNMQARRRYLSGIPDGGWDLVAPYVSPGRPHRARYWYGSGRTSRGQARLRTVESAAGGRV
jgi:hypothetical protein